MNRRILSAVLSSVDKAPTSSTGLGIVTYTAEDGGSLRSVTVIGNTVASVSNPVYPTVATYTHAGDPVTLDDGTTGYRFNLRIHGANFLDADEFLRICRILRPDREDYDFGAQTGTEWSMEKEDSLSKLKESLLITKTTDGKAVYVAYAMNEVSAISGTVIANHGYILFFPIQTERANATRPGRR